MTEMPHPRIDAHLHLWDRSRSQYAWITPEIGPLYADFGPETVSEPLATAGMDGAILVQAEDSLADTRFMLDVAAAHDWVVGVVGWVPLENPRAASVALEEWTQHPVFCGVRQLVHMDPRDDVLDSHGATETLRLISDANLAFDVPNAWPRHLPSVRRIAVSNPELTIVLDHLGTPPAGNAALDAWERAVRDVAACPNVVSKLSGLQHLHGDSLRRVWDVALDAFGPTRLAFGSDWPMTLPQGGYEATWRRTTGLLELLHPTEQTEILSGTSRRTYRLRTV